MTSLCDRGNNEIPDLVARGTPVETRCAEMDAAVNAGVECFLYRLRETVELTLYTWCGLGCQRQIRVFIEIREQDLGRGGTDRSMA